MKASPAARLAVSLLAVAWLFVVVAVYYIFHKPFELANVLAIANTLGDLIVAGLLFLLAASLGRRALAAWQFDSALEALVIQTGIGLGVLAFIVFVLGWLGLVKPLVFWILLPVGLALEFRDVRAVFATVRSLRLPRMTRSEQALAIFIALALSLALLFALAPPTGWDSLQYHLILPKLALENGRFTVPPDNLSLSNPALVEMLFLAAMGLKGDSAAQVMHWGYLVLTVGGVLVFAARYFTGRVGWLAAALLVSVTSVLLVSTYAYNDAALMLYTLLALRWTLRAAESGGTRDFVLAGLLAGLALGEKYTAVFVVLALAALVLYQSRKQVSLARACKNALVLGGVAFLLGLPWYARNLLLVGNPFYPFAFGGLYWDSWRTAWYSRFGTGLLNEPLQLLAVPWTMTVEGTQGGTFDATIGPLLLVLLPLNLLPRTEATRNAPTRAMWFVCAVLFGVWLLGVAQSKLLWQTRLLFPIFPLLALLAAEGWNRLGTIQLPQFSAQRFAGLVIGIVLGLTAVGFVLALFQSHPYDALLGFETRDEYLTRTLGPHYAMAQWVNRNLPANARIVSLWEPRSFYIDREIEPDAILDRWEHLQYLYGDADKIAAEWQGEGVTHLLLFRSGLNAILQSQYDTVDPAALQTLEALEAKHLRLVYDHTPLQVISANGKPALAGADTDAYAIYELY